MKTGDRIKTTKPLRWAGKPHEDIPTGSTGTVYEFSPTPTQPQYKMLAIKFDKYKCEGNFHFALTGDTYADLETLADCVSNPN